MFPLKTWLTAGGGFLVAALLAWTLHSWAVGRLEAKHLTALESQKKTLEGQCLTMQLFTQGNGNALQNDLAINADRLNAFSMRQPATCIAVLDPPAGPGVHEAQQRRVVPRTRGIAPTAYMSLLKEADDVAARLSACQRYAREVQRIKTGR